MNFPLNLVRADLRDFTLYEPASANAAAIRLHANELPWRVEQDPVERGLNRYPEPRPGALRKRLAKRYDVAPRQLLPTRGSDDGIDLLVRTFCTAGQDRVLTCQPCFAMYAAAARLQGCAVDVVELDSANDFFLDADRVIAAVTAHTKIIFLCSPNNPTGTPIPAAAIGRIATAVNDKALVVVDEAYAEFCSLPSVVEMLDEHPNLVVLRTLSKAYGLAGIRIGSIIASGDIVDILNRIMTPYPLPTNCVTIAMAALGAQELSKHRKRWQLIVEQRAQLGHALDRVQTLVRQWPSEANFVLARMVDARVAAKSARRAGYLIRELPDPLSDCVRITIGSEEENSGLIDVLRSVRL